MRIGSLFSGYGGLCELAVAPLLGGTVAWHCEVDRDASRILDQHWPGTPNLGDITAVDWAAVEPVDVLTGGFPCQDLSQAGRRLGLGPDTRSGLWSHMAYTISQLRPSLVVIENVRGILSAPAHSDLEPCPWCVGDDPGSALRALGAVLGDLAGLGYDARWGGVRASDAGAPHGRFRVFVVAYPAGEGWEGLRPEPARRGPERGGSAAADSAHDGRERGRPSRRRGAGPADGDLLPTPRATDGTKGGPNQRGSSGDLMLPSAVTLLPTPTAQSAKHGADDRGPGTLDDHNLWSVAARLGNGNGHGKSLAIEAQRLANAPATDGCCPAFTQSWTIPDGDDYGPAVRRWHGLTRCTPSPIEWTGKATPRLARRFTEWMMGLPEGHVTAVPGLSRNAQLKALGNGVVPQQAALALRWLLADSLAVAA